MDFEELLERTILGLEQDWHFRLLEAYKPITTACKSALESFGLTGAPENVLGMAVTSYIGAHLQSFGKSAGDSIILPKVRDGISDPLPKKEFWQDAMSMDGSSRTSHRK
jgi:hypothetical protein